VLTFSQESNYPSEKYGGCQDAPKTTAVKTVVSEQFGKLTVTLVELRRTIPLRSKDTLVSHLPRGLMIRLVRSLSSLTTKELLRTAKLHYE